MKKYLQVIGISIVASLFVLPNNPVWAADGKLTKDNARQAVLQFLNCASKNPPCKVNVQGVLEIPQQNMARADVVVSNVTLKLPKNDAVTAYAFGQGGGTRLWSGGATAIFAHYNYGRWVLTQIIKAEGGGWNNLNIVVGKTALGHL